MIPRARIGFYITYIFLLASFVSLTIFHQADNAIANPGSGELASTGQQSRISSNRKGPPMNNFSAEFNKVASSSYQNNNGFLQQCYKHVLHQSSQNNSLDFRQCKQFIDKKPCNNERCVFSQISIQVQVKKECILVGDGEAKKAIFDMDKLYDPGECTLFSGGISTDYKEQSYFEMEVAKRCKVYAFDCTVQDKEGKMAVDGVHFSPVCIGSGSASDVQIGSLYEKQLSVELGNQDGSNNNRKGQNPIFRPLLQLIKEKNLTRVDLLKMDIEGHEWKIFANDLVDLWKADDSLLPDQIAFELHTKYAHPRFVPPELVKDKGRDAVNELFLLLNDMGYYVLSKNINRWAPSCCEFVIARLSPKSSSSLRNRANSHGCNVDSYLD